MNLIRILAVGAAALLCMIAVSSCNINNAQGEQNTDKPYFCSGKIVLPSVLAGD